MYTYIYMYSYIHIFIYIYIYIYVYMGQLLWGHSCQNAKACWVRIPRASHKNQNWNLMQYQVHDHPPPWQTSLGVGLQAHLKSYKKQVKHLQNKVVRALGIEEAKTQFEKNDVWRERDYTVPPLSAVAPLCPPLYPSVFRELRDVCQGGGWSGKHLRKYKNLVKPLKNKMVRALGTGKARTIF